MWTFYRKKFGVMNLKGPLQLEQAPRQCYKKLNSFIVKHDFLKTTIDHYVFINRYANFNLIILLVCINDVLIIGSYAKKIFPLKKELSKLFATKDLGLIKNIFVMKTIQGLRPIEKVSMAIVREVFWKLLDRFKQKFTREGEKKDEMKNDPHLTHCW